MLLVWTTTAISHFSDIGSSLNKTNDVVVIGAGIIGCAIANRLAGAGFHVTVIDQAQPCLEASWAAAGMLAPHAEMAHSIAAPLHRLMLESNKLYPGFIHDLLQETGMEIGFQQHGSLMVARGYQESRLLAGIFERALAAGIPAEVLTAEEVRQRQSHLAANIETGVFFPGDSHVDNRMLCKSLLTAAGNRGVEFNFDTPVVNFKKKSGRIAAALTPSGLVQADTFIITAGAWSGNILKSLGLEISLRPIRGQMVELAVEPQFLLPLIHSSNCYIVPWSGGRTLVGATMENVGFDKTVTADGVKHLLDAATSVVPALGKSSVTRMWAGLRPDTSDNLPILGRTHISNLILATGHFRNGILLAPITAQLISELVTGQESSFALSPFRADRF